MEREREREESAARLGHQPSRIARAAAWAAQNEGEGERRQHGEAEQELAGTHTVADPQGLVDRRAGEREHPQPWPVLLPGQQQESEIEQEKVAEQSDRVVDAARGEDGREEAADQAEDRDHLRAVPSREDGAHRGHRGQQGEGGKVADQAEAWARRPEGDVEDDGAGARERVSGPAVVASQTTLRTHQTAETGQGAHDHAEPGRDQSVLDRVAEEEQPGEREHDTAQHRGTPHADPALPVDVGAQRRCGRHRWWGDAGRRWFRVDVARAEIGREVLRRLASAGWLGDRRRRNLRGRCRLDRGPANCPRRLGLERLDAPAQALLIVGPQQGPHGKRQGDDGQELHPSGISPRPRRLASRPSPTRGRRPTTRNARARGRGAHALD